VGDDISGGLKKSDVFFIVSSAQMSSNPRGQLCIANRAATDMSKHWKWRAVW